MADPAKRRATYQDLLAVPEHFVAEILNGELVTHPRPAAPHAHAASPERKRRVFAGWLWTDLGQNLDGCSA